MKTLKSIAWRAVWAALTVVTLAGCGALKGMGQGIGDALKKFKLP